MRHLFSSSSLLRLAAVALAAAPLLSSCKEDEIDYDAIKKAQEEAAAAAKAAWAADSVTINKYIADSSFTSKVQRLPSGVYLVTKAAGSGVLAKPGQVAKTYYKGYTLPDNKLFDASTTNATTGVRNTFSFTLGIGQVIPGWDYGFAAMSKGQKAILLIPSRLAYGSNGAASQGVTVIPPNTPLRFDVELVDVN